jgi:hypothetical protein
MPIVQTDHQPSAPGPKMPHDELLHDQRYVLPVMHVVEPPPGLVHTPRTTVPIE